MTAQFDARPEGDDTGTDATSTGSAVTSAAALLDTHE
jgi:hypothetical protein